jgi:SAM-dependent methyltransferase
VTIPPTASITHQHLLSVVNTECRRRADPLVRILDLGCGDGALLAFLAVALPILNPQIRFEFFGLDVYDSQVQPTGFLDSARTTLRSAAPSQDWAARLVALSSTEEWPFADESFDVVISNQVLEHVADHDFVFRQIARTLRDGGWSAHLFPLVHYWYEGHLLLPFVHRIRNWDVLEAYIRLLSRIGLGKFPFHRRATGGDIEDFAERHADYMCYLTNYLSYTQAIAIAKRAGLRASFRYTGRFYSSKVRSIIGMPPVFEYRRGTAAREWAEVMMLRYVSGVTLFLEKRFTYRASTGRQMRSVPSPIE